MANARQRATTVFLKLAKGEDLESAVVSGIVLPRPEKPPSEPPLLLADADIEVIEDEQPADEFVLSLLHNNEVDEGCTHAATTQPIIYELLTRVQRGPDGRTLPIPVQVTNANYVKQKTMELGIHSRCPYCSSQMLIISEALEIHISFILKLSDGDVGEAIKLAAERGQILRGLGFKYV